MTELRTFKNPIPRLLARRPIDHRGYPVPWFVTTKDDEGHWEFRAVEMKRVFIAIKQRRCWICGGHLGKTVCFVAGPMCGINRNSAEPPVHGECAIFAATSCPFMILPRAQRREHGVTPNDGAGGVSIKRNPGVTMLWYTDRWKVIKVENGVLHRFPGKPKKVSWYAEAREATREEVLESIESGLPLLMEVACEEDGATLMPVGAVNELNRLRADFDQYLPAAIAVAS